MVSLNTGPEGRSESSMAFGADIWKRIPPLATN